jgi:hypothetical protein
VAVRKSWKQQHDALIKLKEHAGLLLYWASEEEVDGGGIEVNSEMTEAVRRQKRRLLGDRDLAESARNEAERLAREWLAQAEVRDLADAVVATEGATDEKQLYAAIKAQVRSIRPDAPTETPYRD